MFRCYSTVFEEFRHLASAPLAALELAWSARGRILKKGRHRMAVEPKLEAPQAISTTTPPGHSVNRRRLLQAVGGVGVILIGGTLYRAYDQGVFARGEGPAYDA